MPGFNIDIIELFGMYYYPSVYAQGLQYSVMSLCVCLCASVRYNEPAAISN